MYENLVKCTKIVYIVQHFVVRYRPLRMRNCTRKKCYAMYGNIPIRLLRLIPLSWYVIVDGNVFWLWAMRWCIRFTQSTAVWISSGKSSDVEDSVELAPVSHNAGSRGDYAPITFRIPKYRSWISAYTWRKYIYCGTLRICPNAYIAIFDFFYVRMLVRVLEMVRNTVREEDHRRGTVLWRQSSIASL